MSDRDKIEKYIEKVKKGDAKAYGRVWAILSPEIYRFCLMKTSSTEVAEDIVSEAFVRAYSSIGNYKKDNFRAYLYAIARNLCTDYYRSKAKEVPWGEGFELEGKEEDAIEKIYRYETQKSLQKALHKLPEAQAEILVLRFTHGLSTAETAIAMGRSGVWARVNQYRALRKLKKILQNNG